MYFLKITTTLYMRKGASAKSILYNFTGFWRIIMDIIIKKITSIFCLLFFFTQCLPETDFSFLKKENKHTWVFSGFYKPESFFGKNYSGFNKYNEADATFFARHTLDVSALYTYGIGILDKGTISFKGTIRNKTPWGSEDGIAKTTSSSFKINEVVTGEHSHALPRNIFWIRELYTEIDISKIIGLEYELNHTIKLGAFSYQLGRGIALGNAFAVGSESLGFYSDSAVDRFAYGMLISNEIIKDTLKHDLYVALLQNKSGSTTDTNAKILGQEYGRLQTPQRGFGSCHFLVSGAFKWNVFNFQDNMLHIQPYWLVSHESEQTIEYQADTKATLGTFGFASEMNIDKFEFGFDCAINLGHQYVKGWDRNSIIFESRNGIPTLVNSHVYAGAPSSIDSQRLVYVTGTETQKAVDQAFRSSTQNGLEIVGINDGLTGDTSVFNGTNRFRDPYINIFNGWMAIGDAGYWVAQKSIRLNVMAGIASGDDFPNFNPTDGSYSGFVGIQELYAGDRVKSAFLLGGAGKVKRPYSKPSFDEAPDKFQNVSVSGFSNLMVLGTSVLWKPINTDHAMKIQPNVIAFWQHYPTGNARSFLGTEANMFFNYNLIENLELYTVASLFIPGTFYTDRKDVAYLSQTQLEIADQNDQTGYNGDPVKGLNDNIAFTFNIGLKLLF